MRHICNAVRSVCKAQAHTSFHDWPWAGIWDLSCSSLFFGLRAADGGAGDWGSFGSWRNSQTRIIIRLLLSHSRQTTDLQWAIIWAIIEQECHADSGNLGVRNRWLTDLHPFRPRPNQTSLHLPCPQVPRRTIPTLHWKTRKQLAWFFFSFLITWSTSLFFLPSAWSTHPLPRRTSRILTLVLCIKVVVVPPDCWIVTGWHE